MLRSLVALAVIATACGDDAGGMIDTDAGNADTDASVSARIVVPATDGTLELGYTVAISGAGQTRLDNVSIADATGTVTIAGTDYDAVVYEMQPWPDFGYTLFQTLAVSADSWYVIWFYCSDGALTGLYSEGTDGAPMAYEDAAGACNFVETPTTAQVMLPAVDMAYPALEPGFEFSGPRLSLTSGAPGSVQLAGAQMTLLPFDHVDCTVDCGGPPGWWELHSLLYDRANGRACFGIFYLFPDRPDEVDLTYSLTLPELSDPAGYTTFAATWSAAP